MKLLNTNEVLELADSLYAGMVAEQVGVDVRYAAPETLPRIESRQVKAVVAALVSEVNKRLSALGGWTP